MKKAKQTDADALPTKTMQPRPPAPGARSPARPAAGSFVSWLRAQVDTGLTGEILMNRKLRLECPMWETE